MPKQVSIIVYILFRFLAVLYKSGKDKMVLQFYENLQFKNIDLLNFEFN